MTGEDCTRNNESVSQIIKAMQSYNPIDGSLTYVDIIMMYI